MTFLHKLAQRLSRLKTVLIMGVVATMACEVPLTDPAASALAQLHLSPKTLTLHTGQTSHFVVVALTPAGDTAIVGVHWSATGGSIVDSGTTGRTHYVNYQSPSQPGQYKIITQGAGVGLSDSALVNVTSLPVASVSVSPGSANTIVDQTVQLIATTFDSTGAVLTGRTVTWGSSNSGVATVSANGLVLSLAAGSATLTASSEGKNGTAVVTVAPVPVATVSVSPSSVSVTLGQTAQLAATPRDAAGNTLTGRVVTWASSNTAVATVTGTGLVTSVAAGSATITATSEGKNGTSAVTITLTPAPVASVSVSPTTAALSTGQTVQLTATPRDASGNALVGRVVTWGSSNNALASVNGTGLVTGLTAGAATITATSEGQSGSSVITVTAPVASVTVTPTPVSLTAGQTVQLTATPKDASGNVLTGRVVTWASSNILIARVNSSGLVTGLSAGSVTITATIETKNGTAAVTVTPAPVASVSVSPGSPSVIAGQTVQLIATPRDASGNALVGRVVTWASGNNAIATVSGSGLVSGLAAGTVTITATSEGINGTATVTVTAALPPPPGGSWANAPAGWSVITDYDMHAWNDGGWVNNYGSDITSGDIKVVNDPTGPLNSTAWQFFYQKGNSGVCGTAPGTEYYLLNNVKQLYYGFWVKFSSPFSFPGDPEIHAAYAFGQSGNGMMVLDMDQGGDLYFVNELQGANSARIGSNHSPSWSLGGWHQVEMLLDYAGTAKLWVDGVLTINATGVHYPSDAGFSMVEISPTWGGCVGTSPAFDSWIWYSHVHVAKP